jgi:hypothetical protein
MFKEFIKSLSEKVKKRYRIFKAHQHNKTIIRKWAKAGYPFPAPHEYKQEVIKTYSEKYGLTVFIEAGTFEGRMPEALQYQFNKIYSIELNIDHYLNAKEKFYKFENISVIKGESSEQLPVILAEINAPALIWLDTHAWLEKGLEEISILKELKAILCSDQSHIILINDARLFNAKQHYPSLIGLRNFIKGIKPDSHFEVENDIIKVIPSNLLNQ